MISYSDVEKFEGNPAYWENSPHNVRMLLREYELELIGDLEAANRYLKRNPDCTTVLDFQIRQQRWLDRVQALQSKDPYTEIEK
jgi:hypothetical protein